MAVTKNKKETCYHIGDTLLCCFLFFPTMVFYWRGIWDLWGVYIYPDDHPKQEWVLLGISLLAIIGYFILPYLDRMKNKHETDKNTSFKIWFTVLVKIYFMVYAAFYMCFWRALWMVADHYFGLDLTSNLINLACTYIPLLLFRASRCCIFPPMFVSLDTREDVLKESTRFSSKPYSIKYFFDSIFSHFVLLGLTILSWRGMWNVILAIIFPDDPTFGDFVSLGIGYLLVLFIFLLEEPIAYVTLKLEKLGFYYKLIWEDFVYLIIFFCTTILWRGAWNLTATYILPDPEVGGWACFIVGTIGLMALQLFSFVSAHGVAVDGSDEGRGAFFPTHYIRIYLYKNNDNTSYEMQNEAAYIQQSCENISVVVLSEEMKKDEKFPATYYSSTMSVYDNVNPTTE